MLNIDTLSIKLLINVTDVLSNVAMYVKKSAVTSVNAVIFTHYKIGMLLQKD